MCRHLAYLGPALTLHELLIEPEHGLYRQSWQPRRQQHGTVNADGFGVGWYAPGDPVPARYRRDRPIWGDPNLLDLARVIRSGAVLAAVRSGTDGMGFAEAAAAPFTSGKWLFSHNGAVPGWPGSLHRLSAALPPEDLTRLEAPTDSALLWAYAQHRLAAGVPLPLAVAETVSNALSDAPGARLNLLATDGTTIVATVRGDTLSWKRASPAGVLVASEPTDDGRGWHDVPDDSLLVATADGVTVTALELAVEVV
ncbi:ergothioneine biosynthesis protein EgtC [Cryptosporangium phraense]|uniref:Gamma-glutamyl-hercynylcysteine sulfoxide hydrolase n=1 Tax=Cryptosporangium phraense TaxID=2593070 RepID=A0A545AQL0_9ACTN|nr:ergothioneine biosynthesis protein EgtC [Cryptosporangium phraense]TQS43619.1 ergothioneine biosynthesis protein EgtC [Cryptosporangium phraense]